MCIKFLRKGKIMIKKRNFLLVFLIFSKIYSNENEPKLFATSIAKSGTHLVEKVIFQLTGKHPFYSAKWPLYCMELRQEDIDASLRHLNTYLAAHAPCIGPNLEVANANKLKIILMIRDPRDVIVSYAHWLKVNRAHILLPGAENIYPHWEKIKNWSVSEIINSFIDDYPCKGHANLNEKQTIVQMYEHYLNWESYADIYITSFEKLVGAKGGGDDITQRNEFLAIARFLNKSIDESMAADMCEKVFGTGNTFRQGQIGSWKKEFTEEQKKAFKSIQGFNQLLIRLNYEKDSNW